MKYIAPKYESVIIETKDVITVSSTSNKYEIEKENDSKGNVIINASNLFI